MIKLVEIRAKAKEMRSEESRTQRIVRSDEREEEDWKRGRDYRHGYVNGKVVKDKEGRLDVLQDASMI